MTMTKMLSGDRALSQEGFYRGEKKTAKLDNFAWSNQIRKNETFFGYKFCLRYHSAWMGLNFPKRPQASPRKNGKTSISSGAKKIGLGYSKFFGMRGSFRQSACQFVSLSVMLS